MKQRKFQYFVYIMKIDEYNITLLIIRGILLGHVAGRRRNGFETNVTGTNPRSE